MHARNRSPANGYRAHSMGMGWVPPASRVSPESSMRGHGGYGNEFRSYGRGGFGRGQSRQFSRPQAPPPPPLPPQKVTGNGGGDIFMEAGKLAAEYLIAKGFLPANALSGKWQNGTLKNLVGGQEGSGRASVLSRLGEAVSDSGPSRRRYGDEYGNTVGSRSLSGRKRNGSFKNYGSEWNREMGRSGSWSERSRATSAEGDDDSDRVSQNSASYVTGGQESDVPVDPRSSSERRENAGAKDDASPSKKDTGKEAVEKDDKKVNQDAGKKDEMLVQDSKDDIAIMASSDEGSLANENSSDLLSFCRFVKIPTRTRSSMAVRGPRIDTDPMIVDEKAQNGEGEPSKETVAHVEELTASTLSTNGFPHPMNNSKVVDVDRLSEPTPEKELVEGSSTAPTSLLDRNIVKDSELPDFEMMTKERGEKRALEEDETTLGNKRPRESAPSDDAEPDLVVVKRPITGELMTSEDQPNIFPSDEKRLLDVPLYPKIVIDPGMEYTEEKQILPGSFKTCDLNLMEAAESNDTHDSDPNVLFPSVRENGKQPISVNIDLSMHNNSRVSNIYGKCSVDGKGIEVIDLENDSMPDHGDLTSSDIRAENTFDGLGGFSSNAPNAAEIPDSSDGYGLMISELMGNDLSSSSVTADVDGLHNDMGLDNGQGILGDDDPIYMSLGEIPLSFMRVWEQPTQEYGKPF